MVDSYEAAGWTAFAIFVVVGIGGALLLRFTAKHQTTRLKLLLFLVAIGASFPVYGFESLDGLGGTNVVAGRVVNWARYTLNAVRLPLFAAFAALCLDPIVSKAFVMFWLGLGCSLPLIFAAESSNEGVWYFWIFAVLSWLVLGLFTVFWLLVPEDRLKYVSNTKHWVAKLLLIVGYAVFVLVGYLIDTPWLDPTNDLSLLQWLNVGWDVIFFIVFGLWMLGWVDLFEESMIFSGMGGGIGGLPHLVAPHASPCAAPVNGGYSTVPQSTMATGLRLPA